MPHEPGDGYIRRIAHYIRTNEQGLAAAGYIRKRRAKTSNNTDGTSIFNPLGWFAPAANVTPLPTNTKPVVLSFDAHHLFYLLMRMEALGFDVGSLDVKVENPSRPMNYVNVFPEKDRSDAMSIMTFASSLSAVSRLSLGGGWWGRPPPPTLDAELKYIFSSFTKIPAISLHAPESHLIADLENEPPNQNAIPLDSFKTLNTLECLDIDPRTLIGWDRLAEQLTSLTIKRSGLEDVSDVFVGAVTDDQARREGKAGTDRMRRIPKAPPSRQGSFYATRLPESVPEDSEDSSATPREEERPLQDDSPTLDSSPTTEDTPKPSQVVQLPSLKWAFLKHLSLADNALTFLPSAPLPSLTSLVHLDLSSNLLVSVPPGLSALYNLVSLNLSDNMIDSVLGIYTMLGQVLSLNLSRNRLESICGLERLLALERVDLRHNLIEESAEIGRLATLPNITEVWVEGNPLVEIEEGYRIRCFDLFGKEGKSILLDGSPPGYYETRYLTSPPPEQMTSSRPVSVAYSPPVVPVGSASPQVNGLNVVAQSAHWQNSPKTTPPTSSPPSHQPSPQLAAVVARGRKKKNKRIVDLDAGSEAGSSRSGSHARLASDSSNAARAAARAISPAKPSALRMQEEVDPQIYAEPEEMPEVEVKPEAEPLTAPSASVTNSPRPKPISRHSRYRTEFLPSSQSSGSSPFDDVPPSPSSPYDDTRPSVSHRRSATMSSKSASRRARVSASVYEPPPTTTTNGKGGEKKFGEAEAFRARIEALRSDMGDGWLKVFNQSHLGSTGVPSS